MATSRTFSHYWLLAALVALTLPGMALAQGYGAGHTPVPGTGFTPPPPGPLDCNDPGNPLANCGFESGTFASWVPVDAVSPVIAMQVAAGGFYFGYGFFTSAPTEGTQSVVHGFDEFGATPTTLELGQDVSIPAGSSATLTFDYRGAWDLQTFGATLDRTFEVHIEPSGGGAPMQADTVLTATAGTAVLDTGSMTGNVDVSSFVGQSVRVNFVWTVPQSAVGPGFFEIDNVLIEIGADPADVTGEKTVTGSFVPGGAITYTVVLTNNGTGDQGDNAGDEFVDTIPAEITGVMATASSGTAAVAGNMVTWNGTIPAAGMVTITIDGTIDPATPPGTVISNIGDIFFDSTGDGINDAMGQTNAPPAGGPTVFTIGGIIPTLGGWGLGVLIAVLALLGMGTVMRRRLA